jgi:hypothetical protein
VDVAVGQPRDDRQAAPVEHPRARPDVRTHLGIVAHGQQHAVAPGERGRRRTLVVERPDRGSEDGPVGVHRREASGLDKKYGASPARSTLVPRRSPRAYWWSGCGDRRPAAAGGARRNAP